MITRKIKALVSGKYELRDIAHFVGRKLCYANYLEYSRKRMAFPDSYLFVNRSKDTRNLILCIAGYQEGVWDIVLPRIQKFHPLDTDVCIVFPGGMRAEHEMQRKHLMEYCDAYGWSFCTSKENKIGLTSNQAILEHPHAKMIFKLDEDIVVGESFFDLLLSAYEKYESDGVYDLGFVVPLINVNGCTYRYFLESIGKIPEYESLFEKAMSKCIGVKAWSDGTAAQYLWAQTLPFDQMVAEIQSCNSQKTSICPHRFSIGAMLFSRKFLYEGGGFAIAGEKNVRF